jgi:hypothetical protein
MIQFTLTILIVLAAGTIAMIRFVRFFKKSPSGCTGCSQYNGSCSLEELKKEIEAKRM